MAVAGKEVPGGRVRQARDVPGGERRRRESGIPGKPGVMRRSPLLLEAGLPSLPLLPPEAPREPSVAGQGGGSRAFRAYAVDAGPGGEVQAAER